MKYALSPSTRVARPRHASSVAAGAKGRKHRKSRRGPGDEPDVVHVPTVLPSIFPRTGSQRALLALLDAPAPAIVVATGSAGSGKTACATVVGLRKLLLGEVRRLVITRPMVTVGGEKVGHLPGSLQAKMAPWTAPLMDILHAHITPAHVQSLIDDASIIICPIGMCRGRTFDASWIIFDEASCATPAQFLGLVTRIGTDSKLVVTGDESQSDVAGLNGLTDFVARVGGGVPGEIEIVRFDHSDVVRNPVIKTILALYDDRGGRAGRESMVVCAYGDDYDASLGDRIGRVVEGHVLDGRDPV